MQVSVENPDLFMWLVVVVNVAVVVVVAAAAGRSLLCSAVGAAVCSSAAAVGRLDSAGAVAAIIVIAAAWGGRRDAGVLPSATGDGELWFDTWARSSIAALDRRLVGAAAGLTDGLRDQRLSPL